MNAQIERIKAENDTRQARVLRLVQGDKQAIEGLNEALQAELGDPIKVVDVEVIETRSDSKERLKQLTQG